MAILDTGVGYFDYSFGGTMGVSMLDAIRFSLLTRPLEEYRHESDKVPAYQLPFIQRYLWLTSISARGIGWSFKASHSIPVVEPQHRTRKAFIASRLRRIFIYYFLFEAALLYIRHNPVFTSTISLTSQGYLLCCVNALVMPCRFYAGMMCIHSTAAIFAVAANIHEPQSWPPPFGNWGDAYTIRRFWGRTWHQNFRYTLIMFGPNRWKERPWEDQSPSGGSSTQQPNRRDSWATSYHRLCNAFLCSALIHVCGDIVLQIRIRKNVTTSPNIIGLSLPFFLLQPVGVLIEDAAIGMGKRMGMKIGRWSKILGYTWVWVWLCWTLFLWVDGLKNAIEAAYPTLEPGKTRYFCVTVTERIVKKVFGVDLASTISSLFTDL
ncbi:membrane bound O-acyl transferase family-domain-containing protein [Pisolithus orientalis]|uniref:membrane bound O-acyl transferase family-domain-containing protein n=1 Tax=Pisolithus orientalis TaxID=936130 RepID=UPI00222489F4|nr:membrane bound O-acyl transferase family-domain-containing protein [Pisolithus orientalis]KAI6035006.1 membrane bound O-acyl transferase family-domain-containing protein [Pisolithus orientalis]